jgi:hypothetical protein
LVAVDVQSDESVEFADAEECGDLCDVVVRTVDSDQQDLGVTGD